MPLILRLNWWIYLHWGVDANYDNYNKSGGTYVAWCFRKLEVRPSGSTSTTGSAKRINTSGTQDDTSCSALASAAGATIYSNTNEHQSKSRF